MVFYHVKNILSRLKHLSQNGVVLTFDDGLKDHYNFVYPELKRRGLWGIFYIPTGQYKNKKILDVHRIHLLKGKLGSTKVLKKVLDKFEEMKLIHLLLKNFQILLIIITKGMKMKLDFKEF